MQEKEYVMVVPCELKILSLGITVRQALHLTTIKDSYICIIKCTKNNTDQPKKKALFSRFAAVHPLREIIFFTEKNKNHLLHRGFSTRNFAEKLRNISRRHSAGFRGETPRNFAMGR